MSNIIRKLSSAWFLIALSLITAARMFFAFQDGYYGGGGLMLFFCYEPLRYSLILICGIGLWASTERPKRKIAPALLLVLLISVGLIPTGHFMTWGALVSIHDAGAVQIRDDARILMDELEKPTHFTDNTQQRLLVKEFVPKNQLPASLQNEVFHDVLVLEDKVFIEKVGLCCLFRGFVIFKEGSDVWKNEEAMVLLDGCAYCWRIRVIDGLYWFHDVPTGEEISTVFHPLK